MADINKLVDELGTLTVLEVSELVKTLEEKWGVSAAAPAAIAAAPAGGGGDDDGEAEEKSSFDVVLKSAGGNKIAVIKVVRAAVAGIGLADAKKMVEDAPTTLKEGVNKEEAEELKKQLTEAGAEVELK